MRDSVVSTVQYSGMALMRRLIRDYVRPHMKKLALAVLCMIVVAAMTATNAWLMQPLLDKIFLEKDRGMLIAIPLIVIAVALISAAANYGQTVLMRFVGQRVIADMQVALFDHLVRSDITLYHDQGSGRLISRFTNDIMMMRAAVSNVLTGTVKEVLTMIFLVGVMCYQSGSLALLAFIVFPVAVYPILKLGRRMRKISDGTQMQLGQFTARLDETFQGVRLVKSYGQEEYEVGRARSVIEHLFALYSKAARVQAASSPMMEALGGVAIGVVIWYGGTQVMDGHTTPGAFFSFVTAMVMAYRPAKVIATLNTNLQEGLAAANRLFQVLDTQPGITEKPDAGALAVRDGQIELSHVSFHYAADAGGVKDISLTVPAGKTVALVGPSGGGKSTLMNLLLRFYDVQEGTITIDGTDIRDATFASLRGNMALVSQETVLFDDTVRANIMYGNMHAGEDAMLAASRGAAADEFIRNLPQGYDTVIGPHGVKLSGGQRQRLAIARAMLRNAPILLLDEATSALDTVSERSVQEALNVLMKGRTTLVIAHRLSTVRHADLIYVLREGRIVESGTHDALLAKKGEYHALYARQFESGAEMFA